ncbi:MAG: phenylpyruvate tautomerase MIF-related protein [Acutalibacteraceae bacterium]|nr:phenylpyruvate tautomerase MIF-related protein [Oscillospiraceae bacterium]
MPFISTKTNTQITKEKEEAVKAKLGKAISALGKSEGWLMLEFRDDCRLWFKGKNDRPLAMVEVSLFGAAGRAAYEKMTAEITDILSSELGIAPGDIYVKYEEVENWGWNGSNF